MQDPKTIGSLASSIWRHERLPRVTQQNCRILFGDVTMCSKQHRGNPSLCFSLLVLYHFSGSLQREFPMWQGFLCRLDILLELKLGCKADMFGWISTFSCYGLQNTIAEPTMPHKEYQHNTKGTMDKHMKACAFPSGGRT